MNAVRPASTINRLPVTLGRGRQFAARGVIIALAFEPRGLESIEIRACQVVPGCSASTSR